jgi:uncharacterized protein YqeY
MSLVEKINNEVKEAIRSRDQIRLNTLRMLKSKIIAADARSNISDADVVKLFKTYLSNLQEALEQANKAGRLEMISQLEKEIAITQEFLPKSLSEEETKLLVKKAITESGAKTKKDLSLVMRHLKNLESNIDGKLAKELVDTLLSD